MKETASLEDRWAALASKLRAFVREREWEQFHDPKNLAMALGSEAGELLAEFRWIASEHADAHAHAGAERARIEAEAADVGIALWLFCERTGIDLCDAMSRKIDSNALNYPVEGSRRRSERPHRKPET